MAWLWFRERGGVVVRYALLRDRRAHGTFMMLFQLVEHRQAEAAEQSNEEEDVQTDFVGVFPDQDARPYW